MAASAKFAVGAKVNHPAASGTDGKAFPEGTGVVTNVTADGSSFVYEVKCDTTGKVLKFKFPEAGLSAV